MSPPGQVSLFFWPTRISPWNHTSIGSGPCLSRRQTTSNGGLRACILRVAGCATPIGSAGHAGAAANSKLTLQDRPLNEGRQPAQSPGNPSAFVPLPSRPCLNLRRGRFASGSVEVGHSVRILCAFNSLSPSPLVGETAFPVICLDAGDTLYRKRRDHSKPVI